MRNPLPSLAEFRFEIGAKSARRFKWINRRVI